MNSVATPHAASPRPAASAAIVGLALLTFFQFPGHTWLQQDTQIYQPILEHLRDPGTLDRDLVVQYPHVSFTLYDEVALGLQRVTGLDFEHVLGGEQIVCRAMGIWGIYLIATAAGLDLWAALMAASVFSLGAMIAGPSVLTFEYEPTPRALAVPLVFCALGLVSHKWYAAAGMAQRQWRFSSTLRPPFPSGLYCSIFREASGGGRRLPGSRSRAPRWYSRLRRTCSPSFGSSRSFSPG